MNSRFNPAWLGIAILLPIFLLIILACASPPGEIEFDSVEPLPTVPTDGPAPNRTHPPLVTLEDFQRFDRTPYEIVTDKRAGSGVTGARQTLVRMEGDDRDLMLKTKRFPIGLDGTNNSPRKELAAFAIQRFFLDPIDYVVPTIGVRCIPLEVWDELDRGLPVRLAGTECTLSSFAFWLQDVTVPEVLYDEQRFLHDRRYAYHLANFNILTYLVSHHDNRLGNFLVSTNDADRRVFAIDNGTTFGAFFFNWFYPPNMAWRKIRVPAIPRGAVNRLRKLTEEDVESLGVVVQMEADDQGILRIERPGPPIDDDDGVSIRGTTLQLGLDDDEIEDVWDRIQDLLEDIDDGKIGVF